MLRLVAIAFLAFVARSEIIDRIEVTVDHHVITELQIEEELRVTALLNQEPVLNDLEHRRAAANRLVQQTLLQREMALTRYPSEEPDADTATAAVRSAYGSASAFQQALASYKLTEDIVRRHLAFQMTTLKFVNGRFRPEQDSRDTGLDTWLAQARRHANIIYVDRSLKPGP